MTRDQMIAHLVLHGYTPYADAYDWVAVWSPERGEGRMCKYFEVGRHGPGWDVRKFFTDMALRHYHETPWHQITDEHLIQFVAEPLPAKFVHDPFGQRGYVSV